MKLESTVDGPVLKKKVSTVTPQPTTIIFNFMTMMAYDDEWVTAQQIQFNFGYSSISLGFMNEAS